MTKKYVCYWGEGYGTEEVQIVTSEKIIVLYEDDPQCIESINALNKGEAIDFSDLSGTHYVLRVE